MEVWEFECPHPQRPPAEATETFYAMGNPSTKLLMQNMSEGFLESTKGPFRTAWSNIWGSWTQYELALLAIGTNA